MKRGKRKRRKRPRGRARPSLVRVEHAGLTERNATVWFGSTATRIEEGYGVVASQHAMQLVFSFWRGDWEQAERLESHRGGEFYILRDAGGPLGQDLIALVVWTFNGHCYVAGFHEGWTRSIPNQLMRIYQERVRSFTGAVASSSLHSPKPTATRFPRNLPDQPRKFA